MIYGTPVWVILLFKCVLGTLVLVIPAWAFLRAAGFESSSKADFVLAHMLVACTYYGVTIYLAGIIGIYTLPILWAIILLPVPLALIRHPLTTFHALPGPKPFDSVTARTAALFIAVIFTYIFLNSITSPYRGWDAIVSWDKWAADWGAHSNMSHYLFGGYAQLVPIVNSVAYKLADSGAQILPLETFVLHGMQVFWAVMLSISLYRMAVLLGASPALALLLFFGWHGVTSTLSDGYSDIPAAATCAAAVALTIGRSYGCWGCRRAEPLVMGAFYFPGMFAKLTGVLWIVGSVLVSSFLHRSRENKTRAAHTWSAVGVAAIPIVLFLCQQAYIDAKFILGNIDPTAHMFRFAAVKVAVSARMASISNAGPWNAIRVAVDSLTSAKVYSDLIKLLQSVLGVCALGGLVASLFDRRPAFYMLLVTASCSTLLFLNTAAYDIRNGLTAVAVLCVCGSRGLTILIQLIPGRMRAIALWTLAAIPAASAVTAVLPNEYTHPIDRIRWSQRLTWISYEPKTRVREFFPEYGVELAFLDGLGRDPGSHLITASPLYRLCAGGLYPLREFSWTFTSAGDVVLSSTSIEPHPLDEWFPFDVSKTIKGWIKISPDAKIPTTSLLATGVHPPKISLEGSGDPTVVFMGDQSFLAIPLRPNRKLWPATVVWRFVVEDSGNGVRPFYLTSLRGGNKGITYTQLWTRRIPETNYTSAAGMLTLDASYNAVNKTDEAIVGITAPVSGYAVRVHSAEIKILQ